MPQDALAALLVAFFLAPDAGDTAKVTTSARPKTSARCFIVSIPMLDLWDGND